MNIHTPSTIDPVPSSSNGVRNVDTHIPETKEELLDLMNQRDILEGELRTLGAILDANNVTMETPLTTPEGFPRDDLDVPLIRITRSKIIHLRNDYKALMNRIEKGLHRFHAAIVADPNLLGPRPVVFTTTTRSTTVPSATFTPATATASTAPVPPPTTAEVGGTGLDSTLLLVPFAEVDQLTPGSPADTAGLRVGDRIRKFGEVHYGNHEQLGKVAEVVGASEGREIKVQVLRTSTHLEGLVEMEENVELSLTPRRGWGGRGLLGCHLRLL